MPKVVGSVNVVYDDVHGRSRVCEDVEGNGVTLICEMLILLVVSYKYLGRRLWNSCLQPLGDEFLTTFHTLGLISHSLLHVFKASAINSVSKATIFCTNGGTYICSSTPTF